MIQINDNKISEAGNAYIIAELSANHEQNYDLAIQTIKAMKDSGADAVKLQTYTADSITLDSDQEWFKTREDSPWAGRRMHEVYRIGETPKEWHHKLKTLSEELGMDFFSSPFDKSGVEFLEDLKVPAYKIASLEITDIPLIEACAKTLKPIIMSTGAATLEDIDLAVKTCYDVGNKNVALLKCTSAYPTPFDQVNLSQLKTLQSRYGHLTGISDHTLGVEIPIASIVYGAKIIEKHFILSRDSNGLDREFSLEPDEFKLMVKSIRNVESAIGSDKIELTSRMESASKYKRSLFAVCDIRKGDLLTEENVKSLRPGIGLHPKHFTEIITKRAKSDIKRGEPISWSLID